MHLGDKGGMKYLLTGIFVMLEKQRSRAGKKEGIRKPRLFWLQQLLLLQLLLGPHHLGKMPWMNLLTRRWFFFFHFPSVFFLLFTSGFFSLPSRENLQLFNAVIHLVTLTWFQKYNTSNGRAGISSQLMPRPKEMLSRVAVPRISSEKYSDFVQSISDFSKDHPGPCDICRRFETILNPILVCSGCKVFSNGPWYFLLAARYLLTSCC